MIIAIEFRKNSVKGLSQALQEAEKMAPGCTTSDLFYREIEGTSRNEVLRLKISVRRNNV